MRNTALAVLLILVAALIFLSFGCVGIDPMEHDDHDEGIDNQNVSEYRDTVYEMKKELYGYRRAAEARESSYEQTTGDYYGRMIEHLDRLETLRDRMGGDQCGEDYGRDDMMSGDNCTGDRSWMTDMMMHMMDFEDDCRNELDRFMELCRNEDMDHDEHLDHVTDHAEHMRNLLDEMSEYCDIMMDEGEDDHHHDHHEGGHSWCGMF